MPTAEPSPYFVPPDVLTSYLDGEAVVLHVGEQSYCRLNRTAATVWRALEARQPRDEIVAEVCRTYDVDAADAAAAVDQLIGEFTERRLLSRSAPGAPP